MASHQGLIPGFVVRPPHLALCLLMRVLTSDHEDITFHMSTEMAAKLTIFVIKVQAQKEMQFPSLHGILALLDKQSADFGGSIGDYLKRKIIELSTTSALMKFMEGLKNDLEGVSGVSPLLKPVWDEGKNFKISRHGSFGIFYRKCLVSFQEMTFDQICNLATEMEDFNPGMLDNITRSPYLCDYDKLESHVDDLLHEIKLGKIPGSLEDDLRSLEPVLDVFPKPVLLRHELSILKKEVTSALNFLRRFCNQSVSHGSNFFLSDQDPSSRILQRIHILMLKMASMHISFEHIQESIVVLEEAFESARICNDEGVLQSCLVLLLQVLIQTCSSVFDPEKVPISKKERFQYIHHLLRRCQEKAIEMKTPHIISFCEVCKASLGVKNHLINNQSASIPEICRMVEKTLQTVLRLRNHVSAGTVVSDIKMHVNDENSGTIIQSLFQSSLQIFGSSIKNTAEAVEFMVDQSLMTIQMLSALSWNAQGSVTMSEIAALAIEASISNRSKVTSSRASAFSHLALMQANRKGPESGLKILSFANKIPELEKERSLLIAEKYIQLGKCSISAVPDHAKHHIKEELKSLSCISGISFVSGLESQIMAEMQSIRALGALERDDTARMESIRLLSLHDLLGLEFLENEIRLLRASIQDQVGTLDLKTVELLQDSSQTQDSLMATLLFCKTLMKVDNQSSSLVSSLLKSILPMVLSESSVTFQQELFLLLATAMIKENLNKETTQANENIILELLKGALELSNTFNREDQTIKFYGKLQRHFVKVLGPKQKAEIDSHLKKLREYCAKKGASDAMDVDNN